MNWNKLPDVFPAANKGVLVAVSGYPTPDNKYPQKSVAVACLDGADGFVLAGQEEATDLLVHAWMKLPELP